MAATSTLSRPAPPRKFTFTKTGVLTLAGFGIRVQQRNGHLEIEDGVGLERRKFKLARVGHGLKRLVIIGNDGFVSFAALRWLADQDASVTVLDRRGKVLFVTGPVAASDARLRRIQASAYDSDVGLRITRELIRRKLEAQAKVARQKSLDDTTADTILGFSTQLNAAPTPDAIRAIESQAGAAYWAAWHGLPIMFPRQDLARTPEHWRTFDTRKSLISESPRLATNPVNAMLNYLYALLEAEARGAAAAMGLDPGLGFLHRDMPTRDSLGCDLMEPCRAEIDAFVLDHVTRHPLKREWFWEERNGNCRITNAFAAQLAQTAPAWARAVAPIAEWVVRELSATRSNATRLPATRLTQQHKREAKGSTSLPACRIPRAGGVCKICGVVIERDRMYCSLCASTASREQLVENAKAGRIAAQSPEAQVRRSATKRRHDLSRRAWSASAHPAWLTTEFYEREIRPALSTVTVNAIAATLAVSEPYATDIRAGRRRPHPRHWQGLARLAGTHGDKT